MAMLREGKKREQQGFTLIEIIAVLVILGILAVVAVPKYFDMQDQARIKAAEGLVASAQSQLSLGYANSKLNSSYTFTCSTECASVSVSGAGSETANLTCTDADPSVITAQVGNATAATGQWNNPDK